jgi:hypothetical protein
VPASAKLSKRERALLRHLATRAWELELEEELTRLFEDFGKWADKGMSCFDLSDKIHEFHNGVSRELYGRYTGLEPAIAVSRAVALGILGESEVGTELLKKLEREIAVFREHR